MTKETVKQQIAQLAVKHQESDDDELAALYEMNVYSSILKYMFEHNLKAGDYDIEGLAKNDEKYEEDWFDIVTDLNLDALQENPPFDVHPDVKELFEYFEENFWPE
jgi:hypothetical protein